MHTHAHTHFSSQAFAFIPASYAIFIVKEREGVRGDGGPKHQQLLSGVSIPAYWLSTWAFDNVSYLIPGSLAIMLCYVFGVRRGARMGCRRRMGRSGRTTPHDRAPIIPVSDLP